MASVTLDGAAIRDEAAFHAASRSALGLPDYYGNTMDSWVDALSYLRDDEGMTKFRLKADEKLQIIVENSHALRAAAPDLLAEIEYCVGGINERYEDYGEKPALQLVLK